MSIVALIMTSVPPIPSVDVRLQQVAAGHKALPNFHGTIYTWVIAWNWMGV